MQFACAHGEGLHPFACAHGEGLHPGLSAFTLIKETLKLFVDRQNYRRACRGCSAFSINEGNKLLISFLAGMIFASSL